MTAAEEENYIELLKSRGSRPGLERIGKLAHMLGDPQGKIPCIHISGTNGKGSVLAYLSGILKEAGLRVGSFHSPALGDDREMIRFRGKMISKTDYRDGLEELRRAEEELPEEERLTIFEAQTLLAFRYFEKKDCDIAVVECGMGGRRDATNILEKAEVCVFTPISRDHTAWLGKTVEEIAEEKSGIIKSGAAVVCGKQEEQVYRVLREAAGAADCSFYPAKEAEKARFGIKSQSFDWGHYRRLKIGLAGVYQPENAALALSVIEVLQGRGWEIPEKAIRAGLEKCEWYGRFSVLAQKPYLIADGAHNAAGAAVLRASLEQYFPEQPLVFLMGVLKDKDYEAILECLMPRAVQLVTVTPPGNDRALQGQDLAEAAANYTKNITTADSVEEGLELARLLSGGELPIIACGSLSWLAALRRIVEEQKGKRKNG